MTTRTYCLTIFFLFLVMLLRVQAVSAQSFNKAYKRYYKKQDFAAADAIFERYTAHRLYGPAARFFLAKNRLRSKRQLNGLLDINDNLRIADSLYRRLPPKKARRLMRKYGVDTTKITELRSDAQRWAMASVRANGTIRALDSLIDYWQAPMPALQPEWDFTRSQVVNIQLWADDYDIMTDIVHRHLGYIKPENYKRSRQLYDGLWPAFQEKYPLCEMDRFALAHPQTFVARDCWRDTVRALLCRGDLGQLLDFEATNKWTALESIVLNTLMNQAADEQVLTLSAEQTILLQDLRRRAAFRERLRTGQARRDTLAAVRDALLYISGYAPRYSAFRLLEETIQFFLEEEFFESAIQLLAAARPYFPDTLPASCTSNFDFQKRVKPYIDGMLPILQNKDEDVHQTYLENVNTKTKDEFSPVLNATQNELYFAVSDGNSNPPGAEVMLSLWENGKWSGPVLVESLSGPGQQIPLSLTADGNTLLLQIDGKLHLSRRVQHQWTKPVALPVNGLPMTGKGVLSADGSILILEGAYSAGSVLNAPDMDLFISFRDPNGRWSDPQALGSDINTDGNEGNPYFTADGKSLYYTSTGYPGLGKSDVFVSHRNGPDWVLDWSRPLNLGKRINDIYAHEGFGYVSPDGQRIFYSKHSRDEQDGNIWFLELKNE